MAFVKGQAGGPGRPKGSTNKVNTLLKDAILQAAQEAHPEGTVGYLKRQASENPSAFMTLLGKVLPTQITGDAENPLAVDQSIVVKFVTPKAE